MTNKLTTSTCIDEPETMTLEGLLKAIEVLKKPPFDKTKCVSFGEKAYFESLNRTAMDFEIPIHKLLSASEA